MTITSPLARRVLAAALAVTMLAATPAVAAPSRKRNPETERQIRTLKDQVEEASAEETELLGRLDEAESRRRDVDAEVAAVDAELAAEESKVSAAHDSVDEATADVVRAQLRLKQTRSQLAAARQTLQRRVVAAYVHHPSAAVANLMFRVHSVRQYSASKAYLQTLARSQHEAVTAYRSMRTRAEVDERLVQEHLGQARDRYEEAAARTRQLEAVRERAAEVRNSAVAEEQLQRSLLDEVQARKAEFEERLADLQVQSSSITALLRARPSSGPDAPQAPGTLQVPIPGTAITSRFGPRVHPIYGTVRNHAGIDMRGAYGTPIRAAGNGVVVAADARGGYGNATIVDHGNGLATLYGHQSQMFVTAGQQVAAGAVIGLVGSTGFSTGPHLHFEVRIRGIPVDPMGYL
ncbi:MAG TPA: peptidoglycan DD-metalloendopeptidase family protein [Acidimicrobiales bacterium]|nr:peptidoglycan DD-metalloendopeptidase family protein [Acidimicrobiales bacterium]